MRTFNNFSTISSISHQYIKSQSYEHLYTVFFCYYLVIKLKILVCSAWPYCHSVPHLGNLIGSLLSGDVFSRYYKIKGYDCLYVSGTDAHGTRTEYEAIKQGVSPRDIFQENHNKIVEILKGLEIEFDNYTSTESNQNSIIFMIFRPVQPWPKTRSKL